MSKQFASSRYRVELLRTGLEHAKLPRSGLGEVWTVGASSPLWWQGGDERQAIGCRSFFLAPPILGNDSVLYHSQIGLARPPVAGLGR